MTQYALLKALIRTQSFEEKFCILFRYFLYQNVTPSRSKLKANNHKMPTLCLLSGPSQRTSLAPFLSFGCTDKAGQITAKEGRSL